MKKLVASMLVLAGCSTTPATMGDAGVRAPDTGTDAGPVYETVLVRVTDEQGALSSATVVIDDASGTRHASGTQADGVASISDVAWGEGRVSVTVAAEGHRWATLAGFTRAELASRTDASGVIAIPVQAIPHYVNISGTVTNVIDPTNDYVDLILDIPGHLDVTGTSFSGTIAAGVPFHVYAYESVYEMPTANGFTYIPRTVARLSEPAYTGGAGLVLDLSGALPTTTASGTLPMPPASNPASVGLPNIIVSSDETAGRASYGFASAIQVTSDAAHFDYTITQLSSIDATRPIVFAFLSAEDGTYTEIRADGTSAAGLASASSDWLVPPTFMTGSSGRVGLHDPIVVAGIDPAAPVQITVSGDPGTLWTVDLPPGATTVTIPAGVAGIDTTSWTNLSLFLRACDPWADHEVPCRREAGGDSLLVDGGV